MKAYIVRTRKLKEVVGIFVGDHLGRIREMVDEYVVKPEECEYVEVEEGGVYWDASQDLTLPVKKELPVEEYMNGSQLSITWWTVFDYPGDYEWKKLGRVEGEVVKGPGVK
jgi:hypothetical protein